MHVSSGCGGGGGVAKAPVATPTPLTFSEPVSTGGGTTASQQAESGAGELSAIFAKMRQSAIASAILDRAGGEGAFAQHVKVLSDSEFNNRFEGAAGVFIPDDNVIYMPQSALTGEVGRAALTLAHEGTHLLQDGTDIDRGAGDALSQILSATGAVDGGNSKLGNQKDEAQAYTVEARIAQELGLRDRGLGTRNGRALTYEETLDVVQAHPIYA
jgi:hypothetical protein